MQVHWGSEQQEELGYQVTYHMYVASRGWLLYTLNVKLVVGWTICETLLFCSDFFFAICRLHYAHVRKDIRLPAFGWTCREVAHSKRLSEPKKLHRDCPDVERSVVLQSMFVIRSTLTCCFSGNVPLLHTSAQSPGTLLHVISFTRPSPAFT